MIRRSIRLFRPGLTMLSILSFVACAGVAWSWWHDRGTGFDEGLVWEKWRNGPPPQRTETWLVCSEGAIRFGRMVRTYSVPGPPGPNGNLDFPDIAAWQHARRISSGELLKIDILDLTGPGTETIKTTRVSPSGEITLPYLVSQVRAAGRTPAELSIVIIDEYRDENIIQRPLVEVATTWQLENAVPAPGDDGTASSFTSPVVRFRGSNKSLSPAGLMRVSGSTYTQMYYGHWWAAWPFYSSTPSPALRRLGVEKIEVQAPGVTGFSLAAPCWLICLALALPPVLRLGLFCLGRLRRVAPNHCRGCGYNLTGNESGTCPECGTPC